MDDGLEGAGLAIRQLGRLPDTQRIDTFGVSGGLPGLLIVKAQPLVRILGETRVVTGSLRLRTGVHSVVAPKILIW
jgi:hypothetical protein